MRGDNKEMGDGAVATRCTCNMYESVVGERNDRISIKVILQEETDTA